VRSRRAASVRSNAGSDDDVGGRLGAPLRFLRNLGWGVRDTLAFTVGGAGAVAILVNALFLQSGPHPAPLFKSPLAPVAVADTTNTVVTAMPRPRPAEPVPAKEPQPAAARAPAEIMTEFQRELARRGFYDGPIDGVHGSRTDTAIRDFEQAAGQKPNLQANEALLQSIVKSSIQAPKMPNQPANASATAPAPAAAPARNDAIGDILASSRRVVALQRALAQFGYGQIKPTGIVDAETRAAIEKFERERKLPVTGQPSDRVAHELAGLTGRALD
jgi:peptidoglycan hydrolase-like protein with peptidoglycan-binding domain